ncbi:tail fiber assembly protein [Methylibium sp.]|uniref:tail fiber assembly protein n=1 Tax=Methylibium sp. TaxID=2067992 RepID=UPI003D0ED7E2
MNIPSGLAAREGVYDHLSQRVDLITGAVVDWQPPAPADTEFETWAWDAKTRRWLSTPTEAAIARDVRTERDRRLAACDWVTARAVELGEPVPAAWAAYRQALRDVPLQAGFPSSAEWPAPP